MGGMRMNQARLNLNDAPGRDAIAALNRMLVRKGLQQYSVVGYNDSHTHAEVLALFCETLKHELEENDRATT